MTSVFFFGGLMNVHMYLAISIDGYIAGPSGELGWLDSVPNPDGDDMGSIDFFSRMDALIMGRNTFDSIMSMELQLPQQWPYAMPVRVATSRLLKIPDELASEVEPISGTPEEMAAALEGRGARNLYVDGGALVRSFLEADLVDEMTLTTIPVLLGGGARLFEGGKGAIKRFSLISSRVYLEQIVQSRWVRDRTGG
jgi:dihydrofolate reductase